MVYSSLRTAELFTPLSYGLHRAVAGIPNQSFLGKAAQHGVYLGSYLTSPVDKGIQMIAFPILRLAHPVVDFVNKPTLNKAALFLPKLLLSGVHIVYYETKKLMGIAIGITGLPAVSKMILGEKAASAYFSYRLVQQFCDINGMRPHQRAFSLFKPYVPKELRTESLEDKKFAKQKNCKTYEQMCKELNGVSAAILCMRLDFYMFSIQGMQKSQSLAFEGFKGRKGD